VRRFFTPGWLGLHALAAALFGAFVGFGWWQFHRAVGGNMRSWGYTFEWPVFAVFVIVMWVKMMYDELHPGDKVAIEKAKAADAAGIVTAAQVIERDEQNDPELAAYNRYLTRLGTEKKR
jgi:DNA-binding transcriptional regulator of glucitol operon